MKTGQFRDLTEEEISNLSLELKIAYFIRPWNISAGIKTLDDWYNTFYKLYADEWYSSPNLSEERKMNIQKKIMEAEFNHLLDFCKSLLKGE